MKIAVISDLHFGYAYGTELEPDSFENAEEAMKKALDADLILLPGDIFDSRVPKTSVWARAIRVLTMPLMAETSGVEFVSSTKQLKKISKRTLQHIPVIALHGTHERRGNDTNAIHALENAGVLVHLHQETIVFEKDGTRVAVHGMSGVPDRYAKRVLEEWDPQPLPDCINIFMMHQSIDPFIYSPLGTVSIKLENLPKGFDLITDGHLHGAGREVVDGTPLIFPGSTVITQLEKHEAFGEKGFYEFDITMDENGNKKIDFNFYALQDNRKFFFEDLETDGGVMGNIEKKLDELLGRNFTKRPIVKLKIKGKYNDVIEQDLKAIERKYGNRAILRFVKELESPEIAEKIEFLRNLREQKMSTEEIGLNLMRKNLEELNFGSQFDSERIFRMLSEDAVDNAFSILTGEQKTLDGFGG
jgi:DNA repair exonuclease SbcCD nuclease subunit